MDFPNRTPPSFALLVYVSAWLKYHYQAAFTAALLNSQPMGFYAPAQLVRNACEHGVAVLPPDVNRSVWDCTLEGDGELRLRLGLRMLSGLARAYVQRIMEVRGEQDFRSLEDFARRTGLGRAAIVRLANAGAFGSLELDRRQSLWHALAQDSQELPLFDGGETAKRDAVGGDSEAVIFCRQTVLTSRILATARFRRFRDSDQESVRVSRATVTGGPRHGES